MLTDASWTRRNFARPTALNCSDVDGFNANLVEQHRGVNIPLSASNPRLRTQFDAGQITTSHLRALETPVSARHRLSRSNPMC